ncbi:MAG: hypothetical protein GY874_19160 [Desulfobacteraceae bacterium]|nr:hypothetical protein [Desulfobacteraceae bacterium]
MGRKRFQNATFSLNFLFSKQALKPPLTLPGQTRTRESAEIEHKFIAAGILAFCPLLHHANGYNYLQEKGDGVCSPVKMPESAR